MGRKAYRDRPRARDFQVSRVYAWENESGGMRVGLLRDEDEANRFLERVYLPLHFTPPRVIVDPRLTRNCLFHPDSRTINVVDRWGLDMGVVMHEAAHDMACLVHRVRKGLPVPSWHGPEFVGIIGEMLAALTDRDASVLRRHAEGRGIAWKTPPPSLMEVARWVRANRRRGWLARPRRR